ncbi:MAG: DUF3667 domain-containing protein [Chthoniobacterales bacterium]
MERADSAADTISHPMCANCGAQLVGQYCHHCGQERVADPLSIRTLVGDLVSNVVDVEHSKMWRSLRALVSRPGFLTTEYLAGRRTQWITPLKLYLSIFAVSFFLYSAFKSVAVYDLSTLLTVEKSGVLTRAITRLADKKHLAQDAFIAVVNTKWHAYMSVAQFVYPLVFAVVLKLSYFRRRFVEQLVFSMHYQALVLLLTILAWPLYRLTGVALTHVSGVLAAGLTLLMILYLILAIREVYGQSWPVSIGKGVLLYFAYYVIFTVTTYSVLILAITVLMRGG